MKEVYSWVPWFQELAQKIADGEPGFLIENAKKVDWVTSKALLNFGDENIDPFSFIYFLAQKNTPKQREDVYRSIHEVFELNSIFPIPGWGKTFIIPTPPPHATALFHNGTDFQPEKLWEFFRKCVDSPESVRDGDFSKILEIPQVGMAKITQCLFLINPKKFIPADYTLPKTLSEKQFQLMKDNDWGSYLEIINELKNIFPGCELYEIGRALYLFSTEYSERNPNYYSVTTDIRKNEDLPADNLALATDTGEYGDRWKEEFMNSNSVRICPIRQEFKLDTVSAGDIILVRKGKTIAYGIGVVERNDYSIEEASRSSRIHVIWLNKTQVTKQLTRSYQLDSFISDGPIDYGTYKIFRNMEKYKPTFEYVESHSNQKIKSGVKDHHPTDYVNEDKETSMVPLNQILYGPPGTGKTYSTTKMCVEICDDSAGGKGDGELRERFRELRNEERIEFVTFHQSYGYEEFVEGLRPVSGRSGSEASSGHSELSESPPRATSEGLNLEVYDGVLKRIANRARDDEDGKPYVLVIDEINRANISKVLGELVTLLEEDKRDGGENEVSVTLPYSGEPFTLPSNLYILGTMNTADRSIALLDTALRRRFEFREMPPQPELLEQFDGIDLKAALLAINDRLEYLIDRDHLIGHAWLMKCQNKEDIDSVMRSKIVPLLAEYFYDDWNKVNSVLGGGNHFVGREKLSRPPGMEDDAGEDRYRWTVKEPPYEKEAYRNLISPNSDGGSGE